MSGKTWQAIDATVATEAREAIEYGLMEAGALGTESIDVADNVLITGYFEQRIDEDKVRHALGEALKIYNLTSATIVGLKLREVADEDWLTQWKKHWRPVEVGRFIIAPPWSELPAATDRSVLIRINPGMAFGTGTHETTRLCLKAIEKYFHGGSFLDVGTGTGILAIAAATMFPEARVEACDTDAEAIAIAKENAELNQIHQVEFWAGTVSEETSSADLVCANLTAPVIVDLLPLLLSVTCRRLILSGILESQLDMIQSRLLELSAQVREIESDGEWIAVVV